MTADQKTSAKPGEIYEQHMVPAIFARWAPDLVAAARPRPGERALDVACGTGVVTRLLAERVAPNGRIVGLDLNAGMLEAARAATPGLAIEWLEGSAVSMHAAARYSLRRHGVPAGPSVLPRQASCAPGDPPRA